MTIGEKIEKYRKDLKLSQEELASQLFVSRQTVSQWENDQTSPTIDNFLRLCDIFHISMNDFFEDKVSTNDSAPKCAEQYRWTYSDEELREVFRRIIKKDIGISVVYLILEGILSTISIVLEVWVAFIFVFVSFLCRIFALYRFNVSYRKNCEQALNTLRNNVYDVCVDKDSVLITVFDVKGKMLSFDSIYPSSIEKKWHTDNLFIIQFKQRRYVIKKKDLPKDSRLGKLFGF